MPSTREHPIRVKEDVMSTPEQRTSGVRLSYPTTVEPPGLPEVKQLDRSHRSQLEGLLMSLDQASRVARFNSWTSDTQLRSHAEQALSRSAWIGGAFVDERLRGVVEIYRYDGLGFAQAAFAVEPLWRRRGIGTSLLHAAMGWCRQSGSPMLRIVFCRTNLPMRRLVAKIPSKLDLAFGEMSAEIKFDA
jgi:GNAT superfamily N-acetyltransferase